MNPKRPYEGPERRRYVPRKYAADAEEERRRLRLTDEEREENYQYVRSRLFEDIGHWSVTEVVGKTIKNLLWLLGALIALGVTSLWLAAKGYLKM